MKAGEVGKMMVHYAKAYHKKRKPNSVLVNNHMNEYKGEAPSQELVDAVVVDFINFMMAEGCGMDLALYTCDIKE